MAKQSCFPSLYQTSFSSSASRFSPHNPSFLNVSSRTIAIASAATSLATVGVIHMSQSSPYYEGSIQLAGILPPNSSLPETIDSATESQPFTLMDQANIAPPDLIHSIDTDVINNRVMATTVSQKLSQKGISINRSTLLKQLSAQTTPQGWLDVRYSDIEPNRVQIVLEEVAQWYASQDSSCESKACDDVMFIESQLPILEQQQQQLSEELITLQNTFFHQTRPASSMTELDAHTQNLLVQQHEQIQHIAHVETRMDELLHQLDQYQTQMHLSHVQVKTGVTLLRKIIPEYDTWLKEWQESDRQLVALTIDGTLPGNLSTLHVVSPQNNTNSGHQHLLTYQQQLLDEMKETIHDLVHQPLGQMPMPIRRLIVEDVVRFDSMKKWLLTLHRLQLLEARRHTLEEMQQDTDLQVQALQEAMFTRAQLQRELDIVTGTLSAYKNKYLVAQHKAVQEELTWQVVSPPEIVYQPKEWVGPWANIVQRSRRLVTLK